MRLHNISLNNLRRRKGKSAFLIIGLLIGVTTAVTLIALTGAMEEDMGKKLDELGANIVIVPKAHDLALNYGGMTLSGLSLGAKPLRADDLERIKNIRNSESLSVIAPKLIVSAQAKGREAFLAGVDFGEELRLKRWWRIMPPPGATMPVQGGEKMADHDHPPQGMSAFLLRDSLAANDILAGAEVARHLQLKEGDTLEINGETFEILGILEETGSQDDFLLFASLADVHRVTGRKGELSLIEVAALCNSCPIDEMVGQLSEALPAAKVTAVKQAVEARMETVNHFKQFSFGISAVVLLIGSLIVFTTMMASVNERTKEIGIFRAIGFRKRHIVQVILLEAFLIGLLAGVAGYAAGTGVSRLTLPFFLQSQGVGIGWNGLTALAATAISVLLAVAASAYPALRAARLDPAEALRAI